MILWTWEAIIINLPLSYFDWSMNMFVNLPLLSFELVDLIQFTMYVLKTYRCFAYTCQSTILFWCLLLCVVSLLLLCFELVNLLTLCNCKLTANRLFICESIIYCKFTTIVYIFQFINWRQGKQLESIFRSNGQWPVKTLWSI